MRNFKIFTLLAGLFLWQATLFNASAQCANVEVTATAIAATCQMNGIVSVTLSGSDVANLRLTDAEIALFGYGTTTYTIDYSVWTGTGATKTNSTVPPGQYTVGFRAFCNTVNDWTVRQTGTIVTVGGSYRDPSMSASMTRKTMSCLPTGQIGLTITNGRAPFTVDIIAAPIAYEGAVRFTNAASPYYIESLPVGSYTVRVTDDCGSAMQRTVEVQALSSDVPVTLYSTMERTSTDSNCRTIQPYTTSSLSSSDWNYYWQNSSQFYEYVYVIAPANTTLGVPTPTQVSSGIVQVQVPTTGWLPLPNGTVSSPTSGKMPQLVLPQTFAAFCASGQKVYSFIRPVGASGVPCPAGQTGVTHSLSTYICDMNSTSLLSGTTYIGATCDKVKFSISTSYYWGWCYPVNWTIVSEDAPGVVITSGVLQNSGSLLTTANSPEFDRGKKYFITLVDSEGRTATREMWPLMPQTEAFDIYNPYSNGYYCNNSTSLGLGTRYIRIGPNRTYHTEDRIIPGTTIKYVSGPQPLATLNVGDTYTVPASGVNNFYPNTPGNPGTTTNGYQIMQAGTYVFECTSPAPCDGVKKTLTITLPNYYDPAQEPTFTKEPHCDGVKLTLNTPLKLIDRPGGTQTNSATYFKIISGPAGVPINTSAVYAFNSSGVAQSTGYVILPAPGVYTIGISFTSAFSSYCSNDGAIITRQVVFEDTEAFRVVPEETAAYICEDKTSGNIIITARNGIAPYTYTISAASGTPALPGTTMTNTTGTFLNVGVKNGKYNIKVVDACLNERNLQVTMIDLQTANIAYTINDGNFCVGEPIQLNCIALGPTTYTWTGPAWPGTYSGMGVEYMRPRPIATLGMSGTYTVTVTPYNCSIAKSSTLNINISLPPGPLYVGNPNIQACQASGQTVNVVQLCQAFPDDDNTLLWYTSPTTTLPTTPPTSVSIATVGVTTWYVAQTRGGGCISPRIPVTLTVAAGTPPTVMMSSSSVCVGDNVQLTAIRLGALLHEAKGRTLTVPTITSTTGPLIVYFYSDVSIGYAGANLTISCVGGSGGSGTYYMPLSGTTSASTPVAQTITTCGGTLRSTLSGTVTPNYQKSYMIINPGTPGAMVSLSGTVDTEACCDYFRIYDGAPAGATGIWTSNNTSVATVNPNTGVVTTVGPGTVTFTYSGNGVCAATTTTLTVNTGSSTAISYAGAPFCNNTTSGPVTINGSTGGTFSAPAGLSINTTTGAINPSTSTPGTYTVTYTFTGQNCGGGNTATTSVTIAAGATLTGFTYPNNGVMSQTQGAQSPTLTGTNHTGGTYTVVSATGTGLTINATTGVITPSSSGVGRYTVLYLKPGQAPCGDVSRTFEVEIITCNSVTISYSGLVNPVCTTNLPNSTNYSVTVTSVPSGLAASAGVWSVTPLHSALSLTTQGGQIGRIQVKNTLPAGTYTIRFKPDNAAYCEAVYNYVVHAAPSITAFSYGTPNEFCQLNAGTVTPSLTGTGFAGGTFTATPAGLAINPATGVVTPNESLSNTYTVTYTVQGQGGCANASRTAQIVIVPDQRTITSISYNDPFCTNVTTAQPVVRVGKAGGTYSLYTEGEDEIAGQLALNATTGAITPSQSEPGRYTVLYDVGCSTEPILAVVTIQQAPVAFIRYGASAGTATFCKTDMTTKPVVLTGNGEYTGGTFSVSPASGLTINPTTGLVTPNTSNPGTYTVSYTIPAGDCTVSPATTTVVITNVPALPTITPPTGAPCRGSTGLVYSVVNVTGETYNWTVPSGWTITAGQGTNRITVSLSATASTGLITVTPSNSCGAGPAQSMNITQVGEYPARPGEITGSQLACRSTNGQAIYEVAAVPGATSYTWSLSPSTGWTVSGAANTNRIIYNLSATAVSTTITVVANNECGAGESRSISVTVPTTTPAQPSTITAAGSNPVPCAGSGNKLTYSVTAVAGMTYNWTVPTGWEITAGQGTNEIMITPLANAVSGNLSVTASNGCTSSTARTLALTPQDKPNQPGTFTAGPDVVCNDGTAKTYSIATVSGATSYVWTLPAGWTGTSTTNSINATPTASAVSGNITVAAVNACGTGTAREFAVTVVYSAPATPGGITGEADVCLPASGAKTYSITAVPGATSYTWTLPTGWTGSSTTNSISATPGASAQSGNITVRANNVCGSSSTSTLAVLVDRTPAQPGAITGRGNPCVGSTVTYSVTAIGNADTYNWTLPSGWNITAGAGTNEITVLVTAGAAASGTISVTASNYCGTSAAATLTVVAVTVKTPEFDFAPDLTLGYCIDHPSPQALPGTSSNGVAGTWTPSNTIATGTAGTFTYTFTPSAGECATGSVNLQVTIHSKMTPRFGFGDLTYCEGETEVELLNTTCLGGITGTWSHSAINTRDAGFVGTTTTYTFTPNSGQCVTGTISINVTVTENVTPAFAFGPKLAFCKNEEPVELPEESTNGVTGSWSPAEILTTTAGTQTYTFTPDEGECVIGTGIVTIEVTILEDGYAAPIASTPQEFCSGATVANLQATGIDVKWYSLPTGGIPIPSGTALTAGTYYAGQGSGDCASSTRSAVEVKINNSLILDAPEIESPQSLCTPATLADIATDGNTNIIWYGSAESTTALPLTEPITTSRSYFAAMSAGGTCVSADRTEVAITITTAAPNAPDVDSPQQFCLGAIVANIVVPNNQIVWYAAATGGTALSLDDILLAGTYYAAQSAGSCESETRTQVVIQISEFIAPDAPLSQMFCIAAQVKDLAATGSGVVWFSSLGSTTPLELDEPLSTGTYYAAQSVGTCYGDRLAVQVTILEDGYAAPIASTPQEYCTGATVANLQATGTNVQWYATAEGGSPIASGTALTAGTYYAGQGSGECESSTRSAVEVKISDSIILDAPEIESPQNLCTPATLADIATDGNTNIVWYESLESKTALPLNTPITASGSYFAAMSAGGECESEARTEVAIIITTSAPNAPDVDSPQRFCLGAIVANIVVPNNQIVWYAAAEGGTPLALDAVLSAGTYYAAQSAGSCESETRTQVVIQISEFIAPEAPLEQAFCGDVQVKDLAATGSGVVWFDSEGSTTPLALDTPLETATYYAAQSVGTCYGDRLAVQVTVSPSCGVVVALKVFLQGPTPTRGVAEMTNYIQEPDPVRSRFEEPKLPIVNPYGIEGSYADINNPEGAAQKVVDWVLVEIWGDVDVSSDMGTRTVLERQALLLQPDGTIVDATGQSPKFEPQDGPVRIIIKHRNHLSVMSAEIAEFTGEVEWDFTTGLDKAHQYNVGNSTPMVLKNGVYCMWAGDLNVDGIINASDVTILDFDFVNSSLFNGEYALSDLNMDGGIDSTDATLIDTNFVEGARSPVSYFR